MPRELTDIKKFLELARRKDVVAVTIKKNGKQSTKFKVRGSRSLYTLKVTDQSKAQKLIHSLPPGPKTTEIKDKKPKKSN